MTTVFGIIFLMKNNGLTASVADIISIVASEGDRSLCFFARKFDNFTLLPKKIRVSKAEIQNSSKRTDDLLKLALLKAAGNIRSFHQEEYNHINVFWKIKRNGMITGQIYSPVERVGIYVPGGRFSYPSTVLMAAIPAKVAGVKKISIVTPPNRLTPAVLYAAKLAGVDEIYRIGGPPR